MLACIAVVLPFLGAVAAGSLSPALARADGDPASDVLLSQPAFVPADAGLSSQQQTALSGFLAASAKAGFPVRVAIVPEAYDLGYVTQLWAEPRTYAEFLGIELSLVFKGPLLVVMPDGFGIHWPGHSTASGYAALSSVTVKRGSGGWLETTEAAVRRFASSAGVSLGSVGAASGSTRSSRAGSAGDWEIAVAALAGLAAALLIAFLARRRRAAPRKPRAAPAPPSAVAHERKTAPPRALPVWLPFAAPAAALLLGLAIILPMLALRSAHRSSDATPSVVGSPGEPAPINWSAGSRRAPAFTLSDQQGKPVSIGAYRGRPVIITFIDPLCRELCPLAAQVLSRAERQLPASERPEVIAVSVNIYGNARANLLQDFAKWNLTPQWRWAVGSPKQLASVWKRYQVEVDVTTKHIAGTTVHYLAHSEMAYVIDRDGYERSLLLWPYTVDQVEHTVRSL